ncbi:phage integrase [Rosenbergiella collisarenosi]|uniref:phage integrase n=1 Tax=Rosenbergiella collisarenosi TaxID=1544695 RepID=UPI001F4FA726|nr:tyrosine-type recombinase/integrase [Rosenbergiella collisarenosi]
MTVRKLKDGNWIADFYTVDRSEGKRGKRVRKKFSTKNEAMAFENYTLQKIDTSPWLGEKKESRTLDELIDIWYERHGITLTDGKARMSSMKWAIECMGRPKANEFSAQIFSSYRAKRLDGFFSRTNRVSKVAPRTVNLELAYFLAVFNELKRLGEWEGENPLENVRHFRIDEHEMAYLTGEQIDSLLIECSKSSASDLELIVRICLSTGARWSEAESLKSSQLSTDRVTYIKTKGKKNRTIPLDPLIISSIPKVKGKLFKPCYYAFRNALERSGIELPAGQLTHVLRHTFASHFMMNGGNILVLQKILGHSDIKMTMRYAHFAPDHLGDALKLNPISCRKSVAPAY